MPDASLHGLRHTHATELLRMGTALKTIQKRLGHANFSSTNIYTHVVEELDRDAADKINGVLKAAARRTARK